MNEAGYIEVEVLKGKRDTMIAQIARVAAEAQAKRAPVQRLADRWARYLVPTIMITALATWILTREVGRAITHCSIIFCPSALMMATPDGGGRRGGTGRQEGDPNQERCSFGGRGQDQSVGVGQDGHADRQPALRGIRASVVRQRKRKSCAWPPQRNNAPTTHWPRL